MDDKRPIMDGFFIEININNRDNNRLRKVKRLSPQGSTFKVKFLVWKSRTPKRKGVGDDIV